MMADKIQGIIIGNGETERFTEEIQPLMNVVETDDLSSVKNLIKSLTPAILFFFLNNNDPDTLVMIEDLKTAKPELITFIISETKNPDLILEGLRAGVTDYLVFPKEKETILPAIQTALDRSGKKSKTASLISFFSSKGGQGTTAVSLNFADVLNHNKNSKVLLLDLNLYSGNTQGFLNIKCKYSPFDLMNNIDRMDSNLLFSSLTRHDNGFFILSGSKEIGDSENVSADNIDKMVSLLKRYFDYIIIDLPHDFSEKTFALIKKTDKLIILTTQDIPAVKSIQATLNLFRELYFEDEKIHIVLNKYKSRYDISAEQLSEILDHTICATILHDRKLFDESINAGKTVVSLFPKTRLSHDLRYLVKKTTGTGDKKIKKQLEKLLFKLPTGSQSIKKVETIRT